MDDTDQTAAGQIRVLLGRLGAGGRVPLFVFDGGYDSAQLSLDLAEERGAVLVRLRCDPLLGKYALPNEALDRDLTAQSSLVTPSGMTRSPGVTAGQIMAA